MSETGQTRSILGQAPCSAPLGVVLRVRSAQASPQELKLSSGSCVVGAARGADLVIDSPAVSRRHLQVELVPEGLRLTDLGSRNGTFYLDQRIELAVIAPGACVRLGDVELSFEIYGAELEHAAPYDGTEYAGLIGTAPCMRQLFASLRRLEGSLVSILIEGESGVGKELVARAVHDGSRVSSGPFVAINCGALPRELAASELFGHTKGSFTGALSSRSGAFEQAHGGTLLLDEVGELPLELQPALLRALESREIRAVGAERAKHVEVRVIAATNRALEQEVLAGRFREDLYFRLAVVRLTVPALRARREDIAPLAQRLAVQVGVELPAAVLEALKVRAYPGNVRELRNVIQAFAALGTLPAEGQTRPTSLDSALADFVDPSRPYANQKEELADRFARAYLLALLDTTGGNQTKAAELAGLSRTYVSELMSKLGLSRR